MFGVEKVGRWEGEEIRLGRKPHFLTLSPSHFLFRERQRNPAVYAESHDEQGLHGVDYQHEVEGVVVGHAVEYEHGLYGEMPRPGSVGGGNYYGDAAYYERYQGALEAEVGGEVEAEERQVIVQEVANPDGEGVDYEQGGVLYAFERHHSLPYSADGVLYLIID